jgi:hypothetical protein
MKRSRIAAAVVSAGLIGSSILLVASPATAATTIDNVTFYGESDFGVESAGYPAGVDWFFGDVIGTEGAHAFDVDGLTLNAGLAGDVQILNQNVTTPLTAGDLWVLVGNTSVFSTDDDWTFQLPLFAEPGSTGFTTLSPADEGVIDTDATSDWVTSQAIAPTYAAGDQAPLLDLLDAVYAGGAPTLLAYGFFVNSVADATIQAIEWDGAISAFTPVLSRTFPSSISITDATTSGIAISLTGVLPGINVYLNFYNPNDILVYTDHTSLIGSNGTFSATMVLPAGSPLGRYSLTFDDDDYAYSFRGLLPEDQPIEVTAAVLPATGGDAGLLGIAGLVLLGGVVIVVGSRRLLRA